MSTVIRVASRESRISSYRDLQVWQHAMDLLVDVYKITSSFPKEEVYNLTSQLKRAAVSIPSNIAEGSSRRSTAEFMRFINIATGSLAELETQLIAAERLGYLASQNMPKLQEQTDKLSRKLQKLYDALKQKQPRDSRLATRDSEGA
jgi:four helix bundle protein